MTLVFTELIADLQARDAVGMKEYGRELTTWNGRDPGLDLHEELLDALVYSKCFSLEIGCESGDDWFLKKVIRKN